MGRGILIGMLLVMMAKGKDDVDSLLSMMGPVNFESFAIASNDDRSESQAITASHLASDVTASHSGPTPRASGSEYWAGWWEHWMDQRNAKRRFSEAYSSDDPDALVGALQVRPGGKWRIPGWSSESDMEDPEVLRQEDPNAGWIRGPVLSFLADGDDSSASLESCWSGEELPAVKRAGLRAVRRMQRQTRSSLK